MKIKRLTLNRETIRLLSDQDVVTVAGAFHEETHRCTHSGCSGCCDPSAANCSQAGGCETYFTNCTGCGTLTYASECLTACCPTVGC